MARPKNKFPRSSLIVVDGLHRAVWRWDGVKYEASTGIPAAGREEAERLRVTLDATLAAGGRAAPGAVGRSSAWRRYQRALSGAAESVPDHADRAGLYDQWAAHLAKNCDPTWRKTKLAMIRELAAYVGVPLDQVRPAQVTNFLNHILSTPGPQTTKKYEKDVALWRRHRLRLGFDPDTGKRLDEIKNPPKRPCGRKTTRAHATGDKPPPPEGRSAVTRNQTLRVIKEFYAFARHVGVVDANPAEDVRKITEPPPDEVVVLTHDELRRFLAVADDDPDGLGVMLALCAGLRRAEVLRSDWTHVKLATRALRVPKYKTAGESGRVRTVPLSDRLFAALEKVPEAQRKGLLLQWPTAHDARRKAANGLLARLRKAPGLAGIAANKFNWNAWRHTFCTAHLDAGTPPGVVCQWAGHTERIFWQYYAGHIRDFDKRINAVEGM